MSLLSYGQSWVHDRFSSVSVRCLSSINTDLMSREVNWHGELKKGIDWVRALIQHRHDSVLYSNDVGKETEQIRSVPSAADCSRW